MNMNKVVLSCFLIIMITLFHGCESPWEGECESDLAAPIVEVAVQDTVDLGSSIPMKIQIANGCGNFSYIKTVRDGNIIYVYPMAKYVGCVCAQAIKEQTVNYALNLGSAGDYTFQFFTTNGAFLTENVYVR
jgi:hypothetical protein